MTDVEFTSQLSLRLKNPAIEDSELLAYIKYAKNDVDKDNYSVGDYENQILDTACLLLMEDEKFPGITSVNQGGVTTSFHGEMNRYKKRIASRRQAAWMTR